MARLKRSSGVQRTTANASASRNKYDPRIGTLIGNITPMKGTYKNLGESTPCPECGGIHYRIKYTSDGKVTQCLTASCGYETAGEFKAVEA